MAIQTQASKHQKRVVQCYNLKNTRHKHKTKNTERFKKKSNKLHTKTKLSGEEGRQRKLAASEEMDCTGRVEGGVTRKQSTMPDQVATMEAKSWNSL